MTLPSMTRQEVPALLILPGAVLATQRVRVGHITLSDRCRSRVAQLVYRNWLKLVYIGKKSNIACEPVLDVKYWSNWLF